MVASDVFSHGTNFAARISAVGYVWRAAGENIATGFQTPRGVVNAWMASTGHCQNILNPTYGNVGTGISSPCGQRLGHRRGDLDPGLRAVHVQVATVGQLGPGGRLPLLGEVLRGRLRRGAGLAHDVGAWKRGVAQIPLGVERGLAA